MEVFQDESSDQAERQRGRAFVVEFAISLKRLLHQIRPVAFSFGLVS